MRKILIDLKYVGGVPRAFECDATELATLSGHNFGNFVFRYAFSSLIDDFSEFSPVNYPGLMSVVEDGSSVERVIASCANWIGVSDEDEKRNKFRADLLERIDAPVVSFGLGAQAKHGVETLRLRAETKRFVRLLSRKSAFISVRDELTANSLRNVGVDNVIVTGCPSNFINMRPDLGQLVGSRARELAAMNLTWSDLRVSISEISGGHEKSAAILKASAELMKDHAAFYVVQSPAVLGTVLGEKPLLARYAKDMGMVPADAQRLVRQRAVHFSSVDAWLDFSRTCDFAFGMRIHGNVVPMQAGVPSLLIGHDSRTSGLGCVMGVPTIPASEFLSHFEKGPAYLLETVGESMEQYDRKRAELAHTMLSFITSNGLAPTDELRRLAAGQCEG